MLPFQLTIVLFGLHCWADKSELTTTPLTRPQPNAIEPQVPFAPFPAPAFLPLPPPATPPQISQPLDLSLEFRVFIRNIFVRLGVPMYGGDGIVRVPKEIELCDLYAFVLRISACDVLALTCSETSAHPRWPLIRQRIVTNVTNHVSMVIALEDDAGNALFVEESPEFDVIHVRDSQGNVFAVNESDAKSVIEARDCVGNSVEIAETTMAIHDKDSSSDSASGGSVEENANVVDNGANNKSAASVESEVGVKILRIVRRHDFLGFHSTPFMISFDSEIDRCYYCNCI